MRQDSRETAMKYIKYNAGESECETLRGLENAIISRTKFRKRQKQKLLRTKFVVERQAKYQSDLEAFAAISSHLSIKARKRALKYGQADAKSVVNFGFIVKSIKNRAAIGCSQ